MKEMGLQGAIRGKPVRTTLSNGAKATRYEKTAEATFKCYASQPEGSG